MKKFDTFCRWIVSILAACLMLMPFGFSIVFSQVFYNEDSGEYVEIYMPFLRDGIKKNIFGILIAFLLLFGLSLFAEKWMKEWQIRILLIAEILGIFFFCSFYLKQLQAVPWADSGAIINVAEELLTGDYSSFEKGNYLAIYPNQIGITWLITCLIKLFPQCAIETVLQVLNCVCAAGIVFWGYMAVHDLWKKKSIEIVYLGVQGGYLPLYFYTGFMYGEIISLFLAVVSISMVIKSLRNKHRLGFVVEMGIAGLSMGAAVLIRNNNLIVLMAVCIVLAVIAICEKNRRCCIMIFVMIIGISIPSLHRSIFYKDYYRADYGYPVSVWVYMGMLEDSGYGPAAYNGTLYTVYEEAGLEKEAGKQEFNRRIEERVEYFLENPQYMGEFYREKLLWQWICPTYQCFTHTRFYAEGYPQGLAYEINYGKYREPVFQYMNVYQSFVYLAVILGSILLSLRKENFMGYIWSITLLGEILFSLLWEAKPRYVFPFIALMLPCCAYGIAGLSEEIAGRAGRFLAERKK